jgi:hypothetical protein
MTFPRNGTTLRRMFLDGTVPAPSEFRGEYFVDMLTILPSFLWANHRKAFHPEGPSVVGHNVFFKGMAWGRVILEPGLCPALDNAPCLVIDYRGRGNSILSSPMLDHLRCVKPGTAYLGRFNYRMGGDLLFLGYFSLTRERP